MKKFWVVAKDSCQLQAGVRHDNEQEANAEAERLAAKHGKRFFVLECIGAVGPTSPPVAWTPMENNQ